MEFTDNFVGIACKLSPCGNFVAHLQDDELVVRDFGSLVIILRGRLPVQYSLENSIYWNGEGIVAVRMDKTVHFWSMPQLEREIFVEEPISPAISISESFNIEKVVMIWEEYVIIFSELELQARVWRLFGPEATKSPIANLPGASCYAYQGNILVMYHPATKCVAVYERGNFVRPMHVNYLEEPITGMDISDSTILAWTNRSHLQLVCMDFSSTPFYYRPVTESFGLISEVCTPHFLAFCDVRETIHIFNKTTRTFFTPIPLQLSIAKQNSNLVFYKEVQLGKYEAQYAKHIT